MNINLHNYEEFILDYLEGNLPENVVIQFQEFLALHPEIEEEINLLAADMPVLVPDLEIVFTNKNSLKKEEPKHTVPFWGNHAPKFIIYSLAASFLLFSIGWLVMKKQILTEPILNIPPVAVNIPAQEIINSEKQPENDLVETATPVEALDNSVASQKQTQPAKPAKRTVQTKGNSTPSQNKQLQNNQLSNQNLTLQNPSNPLPEIQQRTNINSPALLTSIPSKLVEEHRQNAGTLAFLPNSYLPALEKTPESYQEDKEQIALANKLAKAVGKKISDRKNNSRPEKKEDNEESIFAQVVDALVPESYADKTNIANPAITFSFSVNSNTHQFFKDLFNQ
ncbi:MAG: hypothetical protein IPM47_13685 [Sphingobacteriales bacterium]|nr:MAG: hypothetical protein IPM47_13685 [Sphingobacteriales bacterium]